MFYRCSFSTHRELRFVHTDDGVILRNSIINNLILYESSLFFFYATCSRPLVERCSVTYYECKSIQNYMYNANDRVWTMHPVIWTKLYIIFAILGYVCIALMHVYIWNNVIVSISASKRRRRGAFHSSKWCVLSCLSNDVCNIFVFVNIYKKSESIGIKGESGSKNRSDTK